MSSLDRNRFGEEAAAAIEANIARLDRAAADAFRPPPNLKVSEWAEMYRRFPDEDAFPGPWKNETAPELVEIMDALDPRDPCEVVSLIKCAQSGGSASAENWIGFVADLHPGPMLFVQATAPAAKNWAQEKFWPMVAATARLDPARGGAIRPLGERDGSGSNQKKIKFRKGNGYVLLTGATSAADLRQRTVRYAIEDDLDQFEDDLDNQGSPESMVDARLKVYRSRGTSKRLKISTPTIKGSSKIGSAYQASDRRRFHFKCCHCGSRFVPFWSDISWPDGKPEDAVINAPCCGAEIPHFRKPELKLQDGWLSDEFADEEGVETPDRVLCEEDFQAFRARMVESVKRGFHLPGIISTFQSWADMAQGFLAAQGDETMLKAWTNLTRGVEFELKGGRPDHDQLKILRDQSWGAGDVPAGVAVTTLGVDVQGDGVYLELVGWGANWESWQLDARFLPGDTDIAGEGAWKALDAYSRAGVRWPNGRVLPIDQECVDAGYHTEAARAFCEARSNRLAVFGRAGWSLPVLGRGDAIRYEKRGQQSGRAGVDEDDRAYRVGTFGIKLSWYGFLRESVKWAGQARETKSEAPPKPKGLVHVGRDVPEDWFEQVTAEAIVTKKAGLGTKREWATLPGRQNHYLDCRVYNRAAAEKLLLDRLGAEDWARLLADRHEADKPETKDAEPTPIPPKGEGGNWLDAGDDYWP
ncbi:terminase gpA endonuclease subunit [Citromicrobium bathyomarinum]|uniref:phage terminase large subunit family protein n=1 Tax=Citromicrobium bathyomarinum TaxID=72174 RepID=UPI003159DB44